MTAETRCWYPRCDLSEDDHDWPFPLPTMDRHPFRVEAPAESSSMDVGLAVARARWEAWLRDHRDQPDPGTFARMVLRVDDLVAAEYRSAARAEGRLVGATESAIAESDARAAARIEAPGMFSPSADTLLKRIDNLEPVGGMGDDEYRGWQQGVEAARHVVESARAEAPDVARLAEAAEAFMLAVMESTPGYAEGTPQVEPWDDEGYALAVALRDHQVAEGLADVAAGRVVPWRPAAPPAEADAGAEERS